VSDWITGIVNGLGYIGIALLTLLENVFPPIPSELIMPLAGFAAAKGDMNLAGAVAAGSTGSLLGCTGWYVVGRKIGHQRLRAWVERHGRWITLSTEDLDKASGYFDRHGGTVVFFGRLIPGIRTWISVPAGLQGMPLLPFLLYSAIGTGLWTFLLTWAGYLLGENYQSVEKYIGPISTGLFAAIVVVYLYRLWKGKGQRQQTS
jgi:membrane protein DedA with SNARE-associated domain